MSRGALETPPEENQPPQLGKPSNVAAGAPAIISTMKHGISKSGITGAISSLNRVNKFGGFDCPGCAWPDPDGHRTIAEFCENGAKAVQSQIYRQAFSMS